MKVMIIGCGRVGARTAAELDRRGEKVTVVDDDARAFNRLPPTFGGVTVRGTGTDEDVLRGAGAELSDVLMALTEGDNRNALAAQLGKHTFGIPRVIAKINDPLRAEAYRALGMETICRTVMLSDALVTAAVDGPGASEFVEEPTAEPLRGAPAPGSLAAAEAEAALEGDPTAFDEEDA
ncbi:MAG TPA: TrkA family potassium uptake protein [Candidatus Limnocylindria bacterium]|nr:TrkA family potassium uptake protein [Candidatus Limnocylindria bacterium]